MADNKKNEKVVMKFDVNGTVVVRMDRAWEFANDLARPVEVRFAGWERVKDS